MNIELNLPSERPQEHKEIIAIVVFDGGQRWIQGYYEKGSNVISYHFNTGGDFISYNKVIGWTYADRDHKRCERCATWHPSANIWPIGDDMHYCFTCLKADYLITRKDE